MIILGIETSCDETAISIIETSGNFPDDFNIDIKSNIVLSQIQIHKEYGGVFPALAKREHSKNLIPVFIQALKEADLYKEATFSTNVLPQIEKMLEREPDLLKQFVEHIPTIENPKTCPVRSRKGSQRVSTSNGIDAICVTRGPGLEPALWVGINFAKALSEYWQIPALSINHMEGHVLVSLLKRKEEAINQNIKNYKLSKFEFPAISLLVSGGHTELILIKDWFEYEKIGATKDDAVGEAFDKVARILGLPYPGGPEISKLADKWRKSGEKGLGIKLPRPMINSKDLDFSFSGLKTAVLYTVQKIENLTEEIKAEISAEFENAVVETIIKKTQDAILKFNGKTIILGGGVAANKTLRGNLQKLAEEENCQIFIPEINHSTDNALMISIAGALRVIKNGMPKEKSESKADGNWSIDKI
jgi:N6-L-threonylcarbamoyladenine synthase